MGKYSLDAFERYPLVKLRPAVKVPDPAGYRLLEVSLNTETPDVLPEIGEGTVLLRMRLDSPGEIRESCELLRQAGARYSGGKGLAGVVLEACACSGDALDLLARTCDENFADTFVLVRPGSDMADACSRQGIRTGLWLPADEGILPLRRKIGEAKLSRRWEERPVYLYTQGELTPEGLDAARRWHASGANCPVPLGPCMTLRRLMFPRDLSSGGVMPLRMWWQNLGTAPIYRETQVRLELDAGTERFPVLLPEQMPPPGLGDSTLNMTAQLPAVPQGIYSLWCGLESGGRLLPLAMAAEASGGMYKIGEITLDDIPRPYLSTMWQNQYADGYYPLEDPAQPG